MTRLAPAVRAVAIWVVIAAIFSPVIAILGLVIRPVPDTPTTTLFVQWTIFGIAYLWATGVPIALGSGLILDRLSWPPALLAALGAAAVQALILVGPERLATGNSVIAVVMLAPAWLVFFLALIRHGHRGWN